MNTHPLLRAAAVVSGLGFGLATIGAFPTEAFPCRIPEPESRYSMEVLVDGAPLTAYPANGATYVEALKGKEYAIRLTNRTGERVAVALSVDGLNSIDARHTSAQDSRKWILAPWETTTLSGWQTGSGTARRFVFTSEARSYGAWLNRTSDLGVITAAFFREARRRDLMAPEAAAPQPLSKDQDRRENGAAAPSEKAKGELKTRAADELAATGIGREIEHRVVSVEFDEEDTPSRVLAVRYEFHDALVKLGVLPACDEALARRERARGFSDSGFAPDPFRGR